MSPVSTNGAFKHRFRTTLIAFTEFSDGLAFSSHILFFEVSALSFSELNSTGLSIQNPPVAYIDEIGGQRL
jgi:hypothetical protein